MEAFTARLIPGRRRRPGRPRGMCDELHRPQARRARVLRDDDVLHPPFAKPAKGPPARLQRDETIFVDEDELPRYGFQSSLTPQQSYRHGLGELDAYSRKLQHGDRFVELSPEPTQDAIIGDLEADKVKSFKKPTGSGFFNMLLNDTNEGMFADPIYGGNRDFAGWKLIGYPGAQRSYTPAELKNGPNQRTIQSLSDMPRDAPGPCPGPRDPPASRARGGREGAGLMAKTHPKVDVVTIGAGWTSAILGAKLCPKGTTCRRSSREPQRWGYPDFAHDHDSLRYSGRYAMMVDLSRETWTWRPDRARRPCRCASTARSTRARGSAARRSTGRASSGASWSPTSGTARTSSTATARSGFRRARRSRTGRSTTTSSSPTTTRSSTTSAPPGSPGNLRGKIQPGGNPFEAPRSAAVPAPAARRRTASPTCSPRRARARAPPVPAAGRDPLARLDRPVRQRPRPAASTAASAPASAARSTRSRARRTTHLPVALATGRYDVRLGCKVLRIETGGDGRATGVTYVDAEGEEHFQPAELVVVSAFTLENNRLLLLSKGKAHPDGIGNDRGRVGRNYTYQIYPAPITGLFEGEKLNMYMGNTCTITSSTTTTETTSTTPTSTSSAACSSTRSPASASRSTR